jgi:translocator protein
MKNINYKLLSLCILAVLLVAVIGSLFTTHSVKTQWYESIKPKLTPPNYVFSVVWTVLFALIAVSLYLALNSVKNKTKVIILFGINFILNILWSVFYFGLHSPLTALFILILLIISIILMIIKCWKINKNSAYLLIPYLIWCCFALILNYLSVYVK